MKVISTPQPEWLGKRFACEACGLTVEFELKDLRERRIQPYREAGRWIVGTPCQICGPRRRFLQLQPAGQREVQPDVAVALEVTSGE